MSKLDPRALPLATVEDANHVGRYLWSSISGRLLRVIRPGDEQLVVEYADEPDVIWVERIP